MARTNATNFSGGLQFPYATAATDAFHKEDIQVLAQAVDQHDHSSGKGLALSSGSIPTGSITSAMIADGTIVAGDIADGAITSAKILDGTIATADHAAASITNALLASDVARANLLTNGGFEIWQRGNGPFTVSGAWLADRWQLGLSGSDTLSISRNTANVDVGSLACAACVFTNAGGGNTLINQAYSIAEFPQLAGRTVSFSCRVSTTVASAVRVAVNNGSAWTLSSYHPGSGGYQTLTVPNIALGTSGIIYVGVFFSASCTAYVDNANLVVGAQPADYVPLHPADDLGRCQRYYEILGESAGEIVLSAFSSGAGNFDYTLPYKVRKAVTPTVTKVGTWTVANAAQPTVIGSGVSAMALRVAASASGQMSVFNAASTYVTIEANP